MSALGHYGTKSTCCHHVWSAAVKYRSKWPYILKGEKSDRFHKRPFYLNTVAIFRDKTQCSQDFHLDSMSSLKSTANTSKAAFSLLMTNDMTELIVWIHSFPMESCMGAVRCDGPLWNWIVETAAKNVFDLCKKIMLCIAIKTIDTFVQ